MGVQVALVKADDWEGLYVNERLVCEDHEISVEEVMSYVLYQHVDRFQIFEADQEWVGENGTFSLDLRDVVLEDGKTVAEHWQSE